jgi:Cys-tRNA(Pro)/Cys-tRNA(Cys) deacylase
VTPAVHAAKQAGIDYRLHEYEGVELGDGDYAAAVATALAQPSARLFEIFVVPADKQLDLRAAGKRVVLADKAAAERATGYVVGGISPLAQRKRLPTTVDRSALEWETVFVSAGRRGLQIELAPADLVQLAGATVAPIAR